MAAVAMFISKFGRVVLIEEDHPLAIAQKAHAAVSNSAPITADTLKAIAPAASVIPAVPEAPKSYTELQEAAKAAGINPRQSKAALIAALGG